MAPGSRPPRNALRLTQSDLGKALNVSFQQIQKYEKGANRMPASRYSLLCEILGLSLAERLELGETATASVEDRLGAVRGGAELANLYLAMTTEQRRVMLDVARALCGKSAAG